MKFKKFISVILALTMMFLLAACGSNDYSNSSVVETKSVIDKRTGYSTDTVDADLATNEDDVINILLIGQDRRADNKPRMRSDSCMIFSLNPDTHEVSLVSLMRDQYVKDPRFDPDNPQDDVEEYFPINYSYLLGEDGDVFGLIDDTIELNYGIKIDYNMELDFFRFLEVFSKICPIEVTLTQEEADYLNEFGNPYNDDGFNANLVAGTNELDPVQLLDYCRTRYIPNGSEVQDFGRTARQRSIIQKIYDKLSSQSLDDILSLISEVKSSITTDMNIAQMGSIAYKLWDGEYSQTFNSYRIPVEGTYQQSIINSKVYGDGEDLHLITEDFDANTNYINEYIYGSNEEDDSSSVS